MSDELVKLIDDWLDDGSKTLAGHVANYVRQCELAAQAAALEAAAKLAYKMRDAASIVLQKGHDDDAATQFDTAEEIGDAIRGLLTEDQRTALAAALDAARLEEQQKHTERYKAIANLAHKAWTDEENIQALFMRIEKIALEDSEEKLAEMRVRASREPR